MIKEPPINSDRVEITFCISTTPLYLHFLYEILFSIRDNFPSFVVHLMVLQPNSKDIAYIDATLNTLNLKNRVKLIFEDYKPISYSDLRGYIANRRAYMMFEALKNNTKFICYSDINTIFLSPFRDLYINNKNLEAAIIFDKKHYCIRECKYSLEKAYKLSSLRRYRKGRGPLGTILKGTSLAGLQLYKVSMILKSYLRDYVELVDLSNSWFASQEALTILYLKYKNAINFHIIDECNVGMSNFLPSPLIAIYRKKGRTHLYDEYVLHSNPLYSNLDQELLGPSNPLLPLNNRAHFSLLNNRFASKIYCELIRIIFLSFAQLEAIGIKTLISFMLDYGKISFNVKGYAFYLSPFYPSTRGIRNGILFKSISICSLFNINLLAIPHDAESNLSKSQFIYLLSN